MSGVRVSSNPRRTPVTARVTSIGGRPNAAICRYVTACACAAGLAPNNPESGPAAPRMTSAATAPMTTDSHSPSRPADMAPSREPAPSWRATELVVA